MAQHYKVNLESEPKRLKNSLIRLCQYLARFEYMTGYIYRKEVRRLPDDYKMDLGQNEKVITAKSYQLNKKYWKEFAKDYLEVHFNGKTGKILGVYYPL